MRKKALIAAALLIWPIACIASEGRDPSGENGALILNINGFRDTTGYVGVLLFDGKKGFPGKEEQAYMRHISSVTALSPVITIPGVPYGEYALTVMHDRNMNRKLDTNWIGIPVEGVGVSNNAKSRFGPPKFKDALFRVDSESVTLDIEMKYLK